MAKPTPRGDVSIDKLLADRAQFVTWLARLDTSSGSVPSVPDAVRARVRQDYEARLQKVVEELRSHSADLHEQLEQLRARKTDLIQRETHAKETMAEAEVRHAVGEFDESRWQAIRGETTRVLASVREELARTGAEVDRLTEVLATIAAPAVAPEPETVEPATPDPMGVAADEEEEKAELPPLQLISLDEPLPTPGAQAAPAPEPKPAAPRPAATQSTPAPASRPAKPAEAPGRTLWFPSGKPAEQGQNKLDDLAFLKSVSTGEPAAPKRASGGYGKPAEPAAASAAPPVVEAPKAPTPGPEPAKERASQSGVPKTLKCSECGTMNRPTEWYCERCGAELAAL